MATKIGYVQQEPTARINWAEVGANFTTMLNEEARIREEKKAEIDRATREQINVLQNMPTGDSKTMSEWALKYGGNAQSYLLMLNAALKSGRLKPTDYTVARQNLADGTDQVMTLAQEYQNEYTKKMERLKSNDPNNSSQYLEQYLMGTVEGFGNFNQSEVVINPNTGNVSVGFKNPETGELESDPNKLVGVNNLRNRITATFDKYNMNDAVLQGTELFGEFEAIKRELGKKGEQGLIVKYSSPSLRTKEGIQKMVDDGMMSQSDADRLSKFPELLDAWADGQLSNVYNVTSLLTDNLKGIGGKTFDFTLNPAEQDENTILLKQVDGNVVPDFESAIGKKQYQIAKEGLKDVFAGALDQKIETNIVNDYTPPSYAPQYVYEANAAKKDLKNAVSEIGKLYYGDDSEISGAKDYFAGYRGGVKSVLRDENGVSITYLNPNTNLYEEKTIKFRGPDGDLLTQEEFIKAAGPLLTGQTDISTALSKGSYKKDAAFNATKKIYKAETKVEEPAEDIDYTSEINDLVYNSINALDFVEEQEDLSPAIYRALSSVLTKDKFTVTQGGGGYSDDIVTVRISGQAPIVLRGDNEGDGAAKEKEKLGQYIKNTLEKDKAEYAKKYKWQGKTKSTTAAGGASKYNKQ